MLPVFIRKAARRSAAHGRRTLTINANLSRGSSSIIRRHSLIRKHQLLAVTQQRGFAKTLYERMKELVPQEQEKVKQLLAEHGDKKLSEVTVRQAYGGMRGVKGLICDTSELDPVEGIRFRGLTVPEVQKLLPKPGCRGLAGEYVLTEGMIWLLMTGEVPTPEEARQLSEELTREPRCLLPKHTRSFIEHMPESQHPMSQFTASMLSLQTESKFASAYSEGVHKSLYWEYALEDALDLIARIPSVTARIYRGCFRDGVTASCDPKLDWSANWCQMAGLPASMHDLMRMYFTIHTDHEGGNVSAHATHLVGSALSDPYLSFAAGLCGLAGPLHGLANQESLRFLMKMKRRLGGRALSEEKVIQLVQETLDAGQVIPGFGHAVLKQTDPRYMIQREFAEKYIKDDELVEIVRMMYKVVPGILKDYKGGKVANPYPNLDAHSGVLLRHYGLREEQFYTVLFGMGRSIGVMSQYVIDRYLHLPLERPKSVSRLWIEKNVK